MVLSAEETLTLETVKHQQKLEYIKTQEQFALAEHERKMLRLAMQLKIAEAGGKGEENGEI